MREYVSKVSWLEIFLWKLRRQKPLHRSDLFVHYPQVETLPQGFGIWLGHASFYVRIGGKGLLFDPVFGDIPFHKRLTPLPIDPKALKVDLVLISHGHYDHLDLASLRMLDAPCIVPRGLGKYLRFKEVVELEWWEEIEFEGLKIAALPAKHWHRRTLFDTNRALWASFLVENLYFAGDSAYADHFKKIGAEFRIDTALLPIGAYEPRHIMKENHMNPQEAYRAFLDLEAKRFIPYHYGAFILSDEPVDEPLRRIERLAKGDSRIHIVQPGEPFSIHPSK